MHKYSTFEIPKVKELNKVFHYETWHAISPFFETA